MKRQDVLIEVEELVSSDTRFTIIDCRFNLIQPEAGHDAYRRSHIPGAVYAHLDDDLAGPVTADSGRHPLPSAKDLTATLRRLGVSEARPVVVYDDAGGAIAARAWWLLRWAGHTQVRVLDGGFPAWLDHALPLESGEGKSSPGDFEVRPDDSRVISTDELMQSPDSIGDLRLVDARDTTRFRGESEPIDPVAGHIPGTVNLPFNDCLDANGRWRDGLLLRRRFDEALAESPDESWSVMCGSGVTACHLAISGLLAGLEEPRLYVGSWSEWIRDGSRPLGRG